MGLETSDQHKSFLTMSSADLSEARLYYQTKYQDLSSFSQESESFIQALQDLQYMREMYEDGILAINILRNEVPAHASLLESGLQYLFSGLQRHIDLQIFMFAAYEKSHVAHTASLQVKQEETRSVGDHTGVLVKLETDESKLDVNKIASSPSKNKDSNCAEAESSDDQNNRDEDKENKNKDASPPINATTAVRPDEKAKPPPSDLPPPAANLPQSTSSTAAKPKKKKKRQCEICLEYFPSIRNLNSHMKTHTGVDLHPCDQCPRVFATSHVLKVHYRVHTGEKPYKCDYCPKEFTQKGILDRHIRIHTGEKPYKCDQCLRAFSTSHSLKNHVQTHTGEKPFTCDECGIKFAHSKTLVNHKKMKHSDVPVKISKPYKCQLCPKAFTAQVYLTIHMRSHTGERPFECQLCSKAFTNKGTLNHHIKLHKGEKNFKCEICNKAWVRKSRLIAHMRTHTGEKPFKCDVCQKDFSRNDLLKKHMKSHRGPPGNTSVGGVPPAPHHPQDGQQQSRHPPQLPHQQQHELTPPCPSTPTTAASLFRGAAAGAIPHGLGGGGRMDPSGHRGMEGLYRSAASAPNLPQNRLGATSSDMNRMMDDRMQENPLFRADRMVETQLFRNNRNVEENIYLIRSHLPM
eukprot:TRINITY_DN5722_c0_g1_i2.p1 TRINITY_DN5722_c0_g1~~TRINITY_DN5722_c0_g1_i2.p1  ORF type:complete len:632 (+),score=96.54 TRINITY_DN5722_c0_g1_i2:29-1924(+)